MATFKTITVGTYPILTHFLPLLGERVATYNAHKTEVLAKWQKEFGYDYFIVKGVEYITTKADITSYTPYAESTPQGSSSYSWRKQKALTPLSIEEATTWNGLLTEAGISNDAILTSWLVNGNLTEEARKLETAKNEFYQMYLDYPIYVETFTYAKKS